MPILKIRDASGNFVDIPALVGPKGADGTMTFEDLTEAQKESLRGPAGPAGPAGADGATGATGPAGKSAYQTAVDAGYTGTEADFNAALKDAPGHISDTTKHITADERAAWNGKAAGTHASQHKRGGADAVSFADIAFLGANPITTTATDTTANWVSLGSGHAWYSTSGQLTDQPSQYGHLISYTQGADVFQIWNTQSGGPTYFRSGNGSGWNGTWRKVYDTSNKPSPDDIGAAASSHNHSASNITSGTLAVARGGTGQTTVTPAVGTKGVRQIYAGTGDMTAGTTSLATGVIYFVYE